ncbi:tripartite tricarboxylate transporter substrate-binding protein [Terrarubrum flagellatum]|uniref:tripartite tricarboxylate transporter substrate-binding protein n=1 Tax=Terrirubrum flagellatum TaxID=2895980 RepID=UPI003145047C
MSIHRMRLTAVAVVLSSAAAFAQGYPNKPITLVVPFAAGGPTDVTARIIAEPMGKALGQNVLVENVVGAAGQTASTRVAQATPDGYTLIMGHMGTHAASVGLNPALKYDPATSFQPIGLANASPIVVVARRDFPANNLKEFIDYVQKQPDKVTQAHAGVGSVSHTTCLLLNAQARLGRINAAAYRGTGPALNDLLGGQVDFMCDQLTNLAQQINAGAIKAYAVASAARAPSIPNVPTSAEAGLPGYRIESWNAVFAPKGIPADVLAKLVDALNKALEDETTKKRFAELGSILPTAEERKPDGLLSIVKRDVEMLTPTLKESGVTISY